jgi:hypothetical protein
MQDFLPGIQAIANSFMIDDVTIINRLPPDKDDENPFGDDTPEYQTTSTTVKGWFVGPTTMSLREDGGMSVIVNQDTVRLPVGTVVGRGSKIILHGDEYKVTGDPSDENTWPAMISVPVSRIG